LITGGERRRRWSEEDRARILAAASAPGAVVTEVARREDICTSLIYLWRREARTAERLAGFTEVVVEGSAEPPGAKLTPACERETGEIVVEMKHVRIRIGGKASSALIAATLQALRS